MDSEIIQNQQKDNISTPLENLRFQPRGLLLPIVVTAEHQNGGEIGGNQVPPRKQDRHSETVELLGEVKGDEVLYSLD